MILDVLEALDVLATAIAVWIVVGVAALTPVVLAAGWALAWILRAVWRLTVRWARRGSQAGAGAPHSPSRDSRDADTPPEPAQRRSAPHTPAWARIEQEAT